jgi:VanZ family protein
VSLNKTGLLFVVLITTTIILLGIKLPGESRLIFSLQDSGHFLIFTLLTLVTLWSTDKVKKRSIWLVMTLILSFGILIEFVQHLIGRDPSLYDVLMDLLGIIAGVVLYLGLIRRSLSPYLAMIILVLLTLSAFSQPMQWLYVYQLRAEQFPNLVNLDSYFSRQLLEGSGGGEIYPIPLPKDQGIPADLGTDSCVYVSLVKGRWPGVDMQEPEPDWRDYKTLEVGIYSDQVEDMTLVLRVHDQDHNRKYSDRFNRRLPVQPGYNHFSLPLSEIAQGPKGRTMDMGAISDVMIFAPQKYLGRGFCLLSMGLR